MKQTINENIECLLRDTYRREQGETDYCLLYYPSRTREVHCPYLEKQSVQVTLGEGLFSTKLDYWRCHRNDHTRSSDKKIIAHFRRRLNGSRW